MVASHRPLRILHVVGGMTRGGIETWLMHVLRATNRAEIQMDFAVGVSEPCPYDEEVRALGSRILPCLQTSSPRAYARNFRRLLREHGPYDVVHSHVHHFSGYVLRLAHQAGVPVRIAHSHIDTSSLQASAGPARRAYYALASYLIRRHATHGLAASELAASSLFGPRWKSDSRWQVLHYGVDLAPFRDPVDPSCLRASLGIEPGALVLGHVGRFVEQKNHAFLLDVAAQVMARRPDARLLMVGDGVLRAAIEQKARLLGLADKMLFAGLRSDVARLMLGAMDAFVLPSFFEGLPVVGIEAQAAGLPCFLSDTISTETDCVKPLIHRLSVRQAPAAWAETILAVSAGDPGIAQPAALATVAQTSFDIIVSQARLEHLYRVSTSNIIGREL